MAAPVRTLDGTVATMHRSARGLPTKLAAPRALTLVSPRRTLTVKGFDYVQPPSARRSGLMHSLNANRARLTVSVVVILLAIVCAAPLFPANAEHASGGQIASSPIYDGFRGTADIRTGPGSVNGVAFLILRRLILVRKEATSSQLERQRESDQCKPGNSQLRRPIRRSLGRIYGWLYQWGVFLLHRGQ